MLGIIGIAVIVISVLAFPKMYIHFFSFVFDAMFDGSKGIFGHDPGTKNGIAGPK